MKELVAASVNWQLRPTTDTGCIDEPIVDLVRDSEEESIRDVLVLAKEWAKESNFPAGQSDWQVDAATYPHGGILKRYLAGFNHARLGLECDCDGAEQEWETVDDERDGGTTNSRVGPGGRISPGVR
jgi:hypothetical protein